jgi:hypothetical protein
MSKILPFFFVYCHLWITLFTKIGFKFQTLIPNWALICKDLFLVRKCLFLFNYTSVWRGSCWKILKWCLCLTWLVMKPASTTCSRVGNRCLTAEEIDLRTKIRARFMYRNRDRLNIRASSSKPSTKQATEWNNLSGQGIAKNCCHHLEAT